jgi:four helix bundle protein
MRDFKQLLVWQRSHGLTLKIYQVTKSNFPKEEMYGLSSQMRSSSSSAPTNIAEGCGRNSEPELKRFLIIAAGSISELEYQLILARDLGYLTESEYEQLTSETIEVKKMLFAFIHKL